MKPFFLLLAAGLLAAFPGPAAAQGGFFIAPYIADAGLDYAVVAFHLDEPMPAVVRAFSGNEVREFSSPEPARSHFIRVTGLSPSTACRYEVICGNGEVRTPPDDPSFVLRTAGAPGESFTFAVYGDTRPGDTGTSLNHEAVVRQAAFAQPSFCLILGDMVDDGAQEGEWQRFFQVESPLLRSAVAFPVLGDNDVAQGRGLAGQWFPDPHTGNYRFSWGGVQFLALNAWGASGGQDLSELSPTGPQAQWLEQELSLPEVAAASFRVVFLHDPVYLSRGRAPALLARTFSPIFEKHNVDLVFASWHLYERSFVRGVTYVISGGGGAELLWMGKNPAFPSQAEANSHHFCRVDVNETGMTLQAVAPDGTVLDRFTLVPATSRGERAAGQVLAARRLRRDLFIGEPGRPEMPLILFSYQCSFCRRLLDRILPDLAQSHQVAFRVHYYDLGLKGSFDLLLAAESALGRRGGQVPAVFAGDRALAGEDEVLGGLEKEVQRFVRDPAAFPARDWFSGAVDARKLKDEAFSGLTASVVAGAGLLDGINPCAFATIVFLVSYMNLFGASRRRLLVAGGMFTLGVFTTYFVIGLTFYHYLSLALASQGAARVVNLILLALVLVLAALSVRDAVFAARGRQGEAVLKLPKVFRDRIEARVRSFASGRTLYAGAPFVLGAVISGLELTCTGQVYLPIVTMISDPRHRAAAVGYLVLYNLMFILPLVVVFGLAAWGQAPGRAARGPGFQAFVRAANAAFFLAMAGLLAYNLGWIG
ncbi:MAG: metallophosphoesterase [Pseudomonadota bacterium]